MSKLLFNLILVRNYGIKCHLSYDYTNDAICSICLLQFTTLNKLEYYPIIELPCGHIFCHTCILSNMYDYKRYECPTCNKKLEYVDNN